MRSKELYETAATLMDSIPDEWRAHLATLLDELTCPVISLPKKQSTVRRFLRDAGWVRR